MKTKVLLSLIVALQVVALGLLAFPQPNDAKRFLPASPVIRTSGEWYVELNSHCFECEPNAYMTVCLLGFDQIAAFCNGKVYVCTELPQRLQEQITYWMNADHRSFRIGSGIDTDKRKASEIIESMTLIPVGKANHDNAHELVFACGDAMQTSGFHQLMLAVKRHVIVKKNEVASAPAWLEGFHRAGGRPSALARVSRPEALEKP